MSKTARKKTTAQKLRTTARKSSAKKVTVVNAKNYSASEEVVRQRAYELYLARGREPGHELEDWLQAEKELY